MPEVLYSTPEELAAELREFPDHPALTKKGKLRKKALKVMQRRALPSRGIPELDEDGDIIVDEYIRNTELFEAIADEIKFFPESYYQGDWGRNAKEDSITLCGSAFCIAGHGAHLTSWFPTMQYDFDLDNDIPNWEEVHRGNREFNISDVAAYELGLTPLEALYLFSADWVPRKDLSVHKALRMIGNGTPISEVSDPYNYSTLQYQESRREIRWTGQNG